MSFTRKAIDKTQEKRILIGMIVSTEILASIFPVFDVRYFESSYIRKIAQWILNHYKIYKESPNESITQIYYKNKKDLTEDEDLLVKEILTLCNNEYLNKGVNVAYLKEEALEYFKIRSLQHLCKSVEQHLSINEVNEAEKLVSSYSKVIAASSEFMNPFDDGVIKNILNKEEIGLIKFSGRLGDLLGYLNRGYLVALVGPTKRGKTWNLLHWMYECLTAGLKCVFISLEGGYDYLLPRIYKQFTGYGNYTDEYLIPVLDCYYNQQNLCKVPTKRKNFAKYSGPYIFDNYNACAECRENKWFVPSVHYIKERREGLNFKLLKDKFIKMEKMIHQNNNLRVKVYPSYKTTLSQIETDLDVLRMTEGFIPDCIFIDYADIIKSDYKSLSSLEADNVLWKSLKGMAEERKAIVFTLTQGNRSSVDAYFTKHTLIGGFHGKIFHTDITMGLGQTEAEKDKQVCRIGLIAHRHKEFMESKQLYVLQNLSLGQVIIDAEWYRLPAEEPVSKKSGRAS